MASSRGETTTPPAAGFMAYLGQAKREKGYGLPPKGRGERRMIIGQCEMQLGCTTREENNYRSGPKRFGHSIFRN